jgi:hypothetical protein
MEDSFLSIYGVGIIITLFGIIGTLIVILGRILWKSDQDKWDHINIMKIDQSDIKERLAKVEGKLNK